MKLSALLTSAGINIGFCALFLTLYSILRKQPGNVHVYFGRRLAQDNSNSHETFLLERLIPSPSWIVKAWGVKEEEILSIGGLDALVFLRILVFSIRVFSIASLVCIFGVLPVNYYGKVAQHKIIHAESLDAFTIANITLESRWRWVHCFALWVVTCSACILLYSEYHALSRLRLLHITKSPPNPNHFSVIVRSIPESSQPLTDTVRNFFTSYHGSSYLSHQVIYRSGSMQKIMYNAEKVYKRFVQIKDQSMNQKNRPSVYRCGLCRGRSAPFQLYHNDLEFDMKKTDTYTLNTEHKECSAAIVFFKTRYAAYVAAKVLQSSNPMLWVTDLAPEPLDVYWSHLWIPYSQIWIRRIASLAATVLFMLLFLAPVSLIQGLTQLDKLMQLLPFLKGIQKNRAFVIQVVSGYLPSVILMLFLYTVPPLMMWFSAFEGSISRSGRKKSACYKILFFTVWNVFFVNVLSGTLISQLNTITSPKDIPSQLAKAVPTQATFFITYVLTSGWASICTELLQLYPLTWNFWRKYILRCKERPDYIPSFPYYTEVPRVLFFGLLGFTYSILAPLILPFLLVYFFLGYVVYRNQILNVYQARYDSGGRMWPVVHNMTIFSLLLTQTIAVGVFGMNGSPIALGFTVLLLMFTLLFNEYCRKRFYPVFRGFCAQDLIDMDREDEEVGRIKEIHEQLLTAYEQFPSMFHSLESCKNDSSVVDHEILHNDSES